MSSSTPADRPAVGVDGVPVELVRHVAVLSGDSARTMRLVVGVSDSRVVSSSKLREGLDALGDALPDIIVVEQHRPKVYAQAVLRRLKDDPSTRAVPVVIVAAQPDDEDRAELLAGGAKRYVPMPLRAEHLLALIDQLVARTHASDTVVHDTRGEHPPDPVPDTALEPVPVPVPVAAPTELPDDIFEILRTPIDPAMVPQLPMTPRDQLETDLVVLRAHAEASDRRALDALEEADELRRLVTVARADIARLEVTVETLSEALGRARADLEVAEELAGLR